MPYRPTYLQTDALDAADDLDFEEQLRQATAAIRFPSMLNDAISGIHETVKRAAAELPIIVSPESDAMQVRARQQAQASASAEAMPQESVAAPPETPEPAPDDAGVNGQPPTGAPSAGPSGPAPQAGGDLRAYARATAARYGLDPDIFERQINQESGFNPGAVSPAGAQGIAQFMPDTARGVGLADPFEPYSALDAAARHMADNLKRNGGDYARALAAYNAGQGAVDQYGGVPPFAETQQYIRTILGGRTAAPPNAGASPAPAASSPPPAAPAPSPPQAAAGGTITVRDAYGNVFDMDADAYRNRPGGTADLTVIRDNRLQPIPLDTGGGTLEPIPLDQGSGGPLTGPNDPRVQPMSWSPDSRAAAPVSAQMSAGRAGGGVQMSLSGQPADDPGQTGGWPLPVGAEPERDPRRFYPEQNIVPLADAMGNPQPSYPRPGTRNRAVAAGWGDLDEAPQSVSEEAYTPPEIWGQYPTNPGPGFEVKPLPGTAGPDDPQQYGWTSNIPDVPQQNEPGGPNQALLSYRLPLTATAGPDTTPDQPYDPDQGPHEVGYTVGGVGDGSVVGSTPTGGSASAPVAQLAEQPVTDTPSPVAGRIDTSGNGASTYNDPTADGTQAQPLPPAYQDAGPASDGTPVRMASGPPTPEETAQLQGTQVPEKPLVGPSPAEVQQAQAEAAPANDNETYLDLSVPSPPGWQALVDGAGNVVQWIRERTQGAVDQIGANMAGNRAAVEDANAGQSGGVDFGTGAQRVATNVIAPAAQRAAETAMTESQPPTDVQGAIRQGVPMVRGLQMVQDAISAFGDETGRRVAQSLGIPDEVLVTVFGMPITTHDVAGFAGATVLDPTNYIGGGGARRAVAAAEEAAPAAIGATRRAVRAAESEAGRVAEEAGPAAERVAGDVIPPASALEVRPPITGTPTDGRVTDLKARMIALQQMLEDAADNGDAGRRAWVESEMNKAADELSQLGAGAAQTVDATVRPPSGPAPLSGQRALPAPQPPVATAPSRAAEQVDALAADAWSRPRNLEGRLQQAQARVDAIAPRLDEAGQRLDAAVKEGSDAEVAAANRAYTAIRRQHDVATDAVEAVREQQRAVSGRIEQAGLGVPVEDAGMATTAQPVEGAARGPLPTARDEVPRTPSLNSALPFDPASAAVGAAAGAESGDDQEQPDPWRAAEGALTGLVAGRVVSPAAMNRWRAAQARAAARAATLRAAGRAVPPTGGDWIRSIGYSAMIGPGTGIVNAVGNGFELLWQIPKDIGRAALRGNPREVWVEGRGLLAGVMRSGGEMLDALAGAHPNGGTSDMLPLSQRVTSPVAQMAAQLLEAPTRIFSEVPDAFYRSIATSMGEHRAAAQVATGEGLTGRAWAQRVNDLIADAQVARAGGAATHAETAQVVKDADTLAERLTLRGELGPRAKAFKKGIDSLPFGLGHLVMPFYNTPVQMGQRMLERTPVGLRMGTQPARYDKYYDAMAGSALGLGMVGVAMAGGVSGSGPDDPEKKAMLRAQGWQPNSTLVKGVWVPNNAFGVFGPILDTAGEIGDGMRYAKKDGTSRDLGNDMAKRMLAVVQNQVYLRGLSDLIKAMNDPAAKAESYVASTLSRAIPLGATLRTAATAEDPIDRRTDPGKEVGSVEAIRQRVGQGIPNELPNPIVGTRGQLPPAQDVLGRPVENQRRGLAVMGPRMATPRDDPTISAFQQANVDIGQPKSKLTIDSIPVDLTPDETRQWQRLRGQTLERFAPSMTQRPFWQNPAAREVAMKDLLQQANDAADAQLMKSIGAAEIRRRVLESRQQQRQAKAS